MAGRRRFTGVPLLALVAGCTAVPGPSEGVAVDARGLDDGVVAHGAADVYVESELASFEGSVALPFAPRARLDPLVCELRGRLDRPDHVPDFEWTVDGEPFTGMTLGTHFRGDTIFPGYTRPGQRWGCSVKLGSATGRVQTGVVGTALEDVDPYVAPTAWVDGGRIHYVGPLAGESGLAVQFGFDGWSERTKPRGAVNFMTADNDAIWYATANLQKVDGVYVADVEIPPEVRAVHMVFKAGEQVDDAGGDEYAWDMQFPLVGPYLTWSEVARPDRGVVVSWVSGLPGLGVVEYGPDEDHTALAVGSRVDTLHQVVLAGLPPDSEFVYRVRDADGRVSPWSTFRTAPVDAREFTFLVASDMQDGGRLEDRWAHVAAQMAEGWPDARFVVAPGDLAANDRPALWWAFFDGGRELFDHVPLVPALGNHDTPGIQSSSDATSYTRWFDLPKADGAEIWYRLDYGRTRIFSISTEVPETLEPTGAQRAWLRDEMSLLWEDGERTVDWAFAQYHHPSYDAGGRFAHEADDWRPFTEEFDGNVDVVFQAHEHIYQRFQPLRYDTELAPSGEYGLGEDDGVCYIVTPAAGISYLDGSMAMSEETAPMREALAFPELEIDPEADEHHEDYGEVSVEHGFLVAEVAPDVLTLRSYATGTPAYPTDAREIDAVTIRR